MEKMENNVIEGFLNEAFHRFNNITACLFPEDKITLDKSTVKAAWEIAALVSSYSDDYPREFKRWCEYSSLNKRGSEIFQHSLLMSGGLVGESPWFEEFPEIAQIVCDFWAGCEVFLSDGKIYIK